MFSKVYITTIFLKFKRQIQRYNIPSYLEFVLDILFLFYKCTTYRLQRNMLK